MQAVLWLVLTEYSLAATAAEQSQGHGMFPMLAATPLLTRTQIITVDDNTLPVIAAAPDAVTVECIGDVPAMTSLTWTDNCDAGGSVAGVDGTTRWRQLRRNNHKDLECFRCLRQPSY